MENAEAFISAGGRARWDFIVFKHNQHQVEEAEKLANKMGFKQFRIRKTARFNYSPSGADKWPVMDRNKEFEYLVDRKATKRRKLFNGYIECTYYQYWGKKPNIDK